MFILHFPFRRKYIIFIFVLTLNSKHTQLLPLPEYQVHSTQRLHLSLNLEHLGHSELSENSGYLEHSGHLGYSRYLEYLGYLEHSGHLGYLGHLGYSEHLDESGHLGHLEG